jgi:gliding motility-associated-like protein
MEKRHKIAALLIVAVLLVLNNAALAQEMRYTVNNLPDITFKAGTYNLTTFTLHSTKPSPDWLLYNKDYTNHPDAGFLTPGNPPNAIELIAKRTADSRYFIDKDTSSKFYIEKANTDINYQKNNQWLSIDKRLCPKGINLYEASHQPEPVGFDITKQTSYINTFSGPVSFNNWELAGQKGTAQTVLAIADWTHFSAGDDGIKITDIFPGIDAIMIVDRGSIKTSFIVKNDQFKGYDRLMFTDAFETSAPADLIVSQQEVGMKDGVDLISGKNQLLHINNATMCAENDPSTTTELLDYSIADNKLSMLINERDLDDRLSKGTVLIDPLVSVLDSIPKVSIGGSMNNGNVNLRCNYDLPVDLPANATFTNVYYSLGYSMNPPATASQGFATVTMMGCSGGILISDDPSDPNYLHTNVFLSLGLTDGTPYLLHCLPPPACITQNVTFVLGLFNTVTAGPNGVCSNEYESPYQAFEIYIAGQTLGTNSISPATFICATSPATISAGAINGVPPYTYSWDHGAGNGSSVSVSPATTTTYTVTITDQCNNNVSANTTVTVASQVTPTIVISTPDTIVCAGSPVVFSAAATNGGTTPAYQWQLNGTNDGTNNTSYTNNTLATGDKISCILTSNANCTVTATDTSNIIAMTVLPVVTPSITISALPNNVCGETPITFTAIPVNAGPSPGYQWQVSGIDTGPDDSLYTTDSLLDGAVVDCRIAVSNTGCYSNSSANSNAITMDIKPVPGIVLTATKTVIPRGETTALNAAVTGGYSSFTWMPSTGLSDLSITDPVAAPLINTTYLINVTDTDGCVKSDSILIGVYDPVFIPNSFTPDGTGNNYFRVPPSISFNLTDLSVYNRWGTRVFETADIGQGWDGTFQGNKCDAGSYVYIITGSDAKGKVFVKGTVTLFR